MRLLTNSLKSAKEAVKLREFNQNESKKSKGFTLIEVVVVLAITVMIAGVVYTFYNSNNRTLTAAEAKSILESEANQIQKELMSVGTQADSIIITDIDGSNVKEFKFTAYDDIDKTAKSTYVFESKQNSSELSKSGQLYNMYIYKDGATEKGQPKSKHIKSVEINTLDGKSISDTSNVQIVINMYIKKGLNEYDYPVTTVVKLRNKNK